MARLVVFDCDGTLVDSQRAIIEAMRRAFAALGLPRPADTAVRRVIGLSLPQAMARLRPEDDERAQARLVAAYRESFLALRADPAHREPLFAGAREAVEALEAAGFLLGIATGKSRRGLQATLERTGLAGRFVTLQTADDAPSKPHPAMLERAMDEAGAEADETVLVGDTTFDIEMALAAGALPFGVSWGYHAPDALAAAGARSVVDDFEALVAAIGALGASKAERP